LSDGKDYHVLLSVDDGRAALSVDDVQVGSTQEVGMLRNCDDAAASCVLFLGARSSGGGGAHFFTGVINEAKVFKGEALLAYPK
jgi:hypothetical protein